MGPLKQGTLNSSVCMLALLQILATQAVALAQAEEKPPEENTAQLATPQQTPPPLFFRITENALEESAIRILDQDARLVVRKLRFENGMELRRLTALYFQGLEFVFFHSFEPEPREMNLNPATGQILAPDQGESSRPLQRPSESFEPSKKLRIRSLYSLALRQENNPLAALGNDSLSTLLQKENPCEKTEIPGFVKLSLPEDSPTHSAFSLTHQPSSPFFNSSLWVCASLSE